MNNAVFKLAREMVKANPEWVLETSKGRIVKADSLSSLLQIMEAVPNYRYGEISRAGVVAFNVYSDWKDREKLKKFISFSFCDNITRQYYHNPYKALQDGKALLFDYQIRHYGTKEMSDLMTAEIDELIELVSKASYDTYNRSQILWNWFQLHEL